MKSSKIFRGIGAALLAIVGAITTAAAHRTTPVFYSTGTACIRVDATYDCSTTISPNPCTAAIGALHRQLFASVHPFNNKKCIFPLFEEDWGDAKLSR